VFPKVCSADHLWSAILAQVVRESQYKSIFCASRSTKILLVVRAPEKFWNHWARWVRSDHFEANCIFEAKANNWLESTIKPVTQVKLVQIPDMHYSKSFYFCKLLKNITEEFFCV
jgi:hypothetical protein